MATPKGTVTPKGMVTPKGVPKGMAMPVTPMMDWEAARRRVNTQLHERPETLEAEQQGEDMPMNTNYHFRRAEDALALGQHASLPELVGVGHNNAVLASVLYQKVERFENRIMGLVNEIAENTGGHVPQLLARDRKKKKAAEQHYKHSELKGLIMRIKGEDGREAHMVVDGAWKMLEGEGESEITVNGDVVELLPAENEEEEPSLWQRVLPGKHRESEPFCAGMVLGEMQRERSYVGRILPLPPPGFGHMVVDKVVAMQTLLAQGQRVTSTKIEDGTAVWIRQGGEEQLISEVQLREEHLLPISDNVQGEGAPRAGRQAGQTVRLFCSAPARKEWPSWLQVSPRPWGVVRSANKSKPSEHLVEFAVRGTRVGSEEPGQDVEFMTISIPLQHLERSRGGERATDIIEAWPRPGLQKRVQFSHVLCSATGAQVRKDFRGIVKRYESHVSKGERVELALGEAPSAQTIWCRRDKPGEFSFSHLILDRDEVDTYNNSALVQQLVAWQQLGAKKKTAKPREDALPEDVPLALVVKLDGRAKRQYDLVARVTAHSAKGGVLLSLPFAGSDEQMHLPRSSVISLRQLDPLHEHTNEEWVRRFVRLEQFREGQHLRLRLKLPKKLGDAGVEIVCKVLSGCDESSWRLLLPSRASKLVIVTERSARSYDYLGEAEATDYNSDDCLNMLAKMFLTPSPPGKAPLCAETRALKFELPLKRKLGADSPALRRAEELLELGCKYAYLAQDVEPGDQELNLVFPFSNGQQRLYKVPRDYLQRVLFFDNTGETLNTHCWPKVGDAVRVLGGPNAGADGFVLRVNAGDLKLTVQLKATDGGLAEAEMLSEELMVLTRSAEDRTSMGAALGVPLPALAPTMGGGAEAPPEPKKRAAKSVRPEEDAQKKKRKGAAAGSTRGAAPKKKQQRQKKTDVLMDDLDPSDSEGPISVAPSKTQQRQKKTDLPTEDLDPSDIE